MMEINKWLSSTNHLEKLFKTEVVVQDGIHYYSNSPYN